MQVDQHTRSQKHLIILDTIKQNDHCEISSILPFTEKHDKKGQDFSKDCKFFWSPLMIRFSNVIF